ncbi:hypothetical protein DFH09DRAFT_1316719 [Mycena vulgaris]|nr:hypothetical protein DFH09DRAFT_1316719 [Mycena vulgaris]
MTRGRIHQRGIGAIHATATAQGPQSVNGAAHAHAHPVAKSGRHPQRDKHPPTTRTPIRASHRIIIQQAYTSEDGQHERARPFTIVNAPPPLNPSPHDPRTRAREPQCQSLRGYPQPRLLALVFPVAPTLRGTHSQASAPLSALESGSAASQYSMPATASNRASASAWVGESASGADVSLEQEPRLLPLVLPAEPALCALAGFGARVRVLREQSLPQSPRGHTQLLARARALVLPEAAAARWCSTVHATAKPCVSRASACTSPAALALKRRCSTPTRQVAVPASPLIAWRATTRHDPEALGYRILVPHLVDPKHSSIGLGAPNAQGMCSVWVCDTAGGALWLRECRSSHGAHGAHDPRQRQRTLAQTASPALSLLLSRTPSFSPRSQRNPTVPFLFLFVLGPTISFLMLTYTVLHQRLRRPFPTPTALSPPRLGFVAANYTHTLQPSP